VADHAEQGQGIAGQTTYDDELPDRQIIANFRDEKADDDKT